MIKTGPIFQRPPKQPKVSSFNVDAGARNNKSFIPDFEVELAKLIGPAAAGAVRLVDILRDGGARLAVDWLGFGRNDLIFQLEADDSFTLLMMDFLL